MSIPTWICVTHGQAECSSCGEKLAYDTVLDRLVEKVSQARGQEAPTYGENWGDEEVLQAADAPDLVLLLREARDHLMADHPYEPSSVRDLVARIDAVLRP